jgi:branched-chain amino acid transport system ATP-binding protein
MIPLRIDNLAKSFGQLRAVDGVNLKVEQGEIRCIIGPNGAGKTTLFNLITGRLKPDTGKVFFKDEDITGLPPHKVVRKSIGRSFQVSNIYPTLTVFQNIRVAILSNKFKSHIFFRPVSRFSDENDETADILQKMNLYEEKDMPSDALSHGDRKKLELGMVIAMKPDLLLLDEPTAGMNPIETESTISLIRDIARQLGLTLILTEHDMRVVFSLADKIAFMHYGKILCEGEPNEIRENETVRKIYLGEEN